MGKQNHRRGMQTAFSRKKVSFIYFQTLRKLMCACCALKRTSLNYHIKKI